MIDSRTIDVQQFIDHQRFSPYQWRILIACFLLVAIDIYDNVALSFVVPVLAQDLGVAKSAFGPVMSASIFGLSIGALAAGPLFERFTPKFVMIGAMWMFGLCSFATVMADSVTSLGVWRFLTGLGLGAAMPATATLMYEYAPRRMGALLVNALCCGGMIGASACGWAAAVMVPAYGWKSVFVLGGVLPLVLGLYMLLATPQPLHFMVQHGYPAPAIAAVLRRIAPGAALDATRFVLEDAAPPSRGGVGLVLSKGLRIGTGMLWLGYFFACIAYYLLLGWMPTLFQTIGATWRQSTLMTTLLTVGGIVGTLFFGWLMDRFEKNAVIGMAFAIGGLGVWAIGQNSQDLGWVSASIVLTGIGLSGGMASMIFLAAAFYPATARSLGVSWMQGIGRFGGILGPILGGVMLRENFGFDAVFNTMAVIILGAGGAVLVKRAMTRPARVSALQSESA
ncbi:4-hydroxybenzoate transporter [Cupriavidus necator]|uniref:MFS transporter n=1 Tax=Cupriavidus necator TaxID=106590 RepID=UPI000735545C|nr:MFS transporter [Cupriavidus necator]KUE86332.1 4-hydroxybenzoate transporter [Cupriavidus necator]